MPKKKKETVKHKIELFKLHTGLSKTTYYRMQHDISVANQIGKQFKHTLYAPKFSTKIEKIPDRQQFYKIRESLNTVLAPNYIQNINAQLRADLYSNIKELFGNAHSDEIIARLEQLTVAEIHKFFKKNKDIQTLPYESKMRVFEIIGLTAENLNARLDKKYKWTNPKIEKSPKVIVIK